MADTMAVNMPAFRGLNQYGAGMGADVRYAVEAVNALTAEGVLSPMAACEQLAAALPAPIETLARLHRRWHAGPKDILIAASGGQLYWMEPGGSAWTRMNMPFGWAQESYQSSRWSCVSYEINPDGTADTAPVDVLLMSNALDGMICVRGDNMEVSPVATPKKFGVIARHAERIWGGAIPDDPDMLVYSAPFDPFDWSQNDEIPENGAGDVMQPSWDGDSFTALTPLGSQLIALKRTRVWRILGTNPGEYIFREQFGGGTPCASTVAVHNARLFMLGMGGVWQYDGESVSPWEQEWARDVFARMNTDAMEGACACMHGSVYLCALPLDKSTVNNAVLLYNTRENTWLLREGISVEAFLSVGETLYFTSAETPGRIWQWRDDAWPEKQNVQSMRWVSPWMDLGAPDVIKGGFLLYVTVECAADTPVTLGIQTEKHVRRKSVMFHPPKEGAQALQRRICFPGHGRRFRLLIESGAGQPWRIPGGITIRCMADRE